MGFYVYYAHPVEKFKNYYLLEKGIITRFFKAFGKGCVSVITHLKMSILCSTSKVPQRDHFVHLSNCLFICHALLLLTSNIILNTFCNDYYCL